MKEGWSNCKIGDICSITDFVSNGSFASLKENVKYYNSPNYAVLVRLADASNGFDRSKFVYTDEHGYDFSKKSHLHGGELIMSNVGSVGSMFICPVMKQPMTLAPNTISITSQNNRFLYYYFLSDGFKAKLKGITSSTTLKKFNKTNFKLLEICIPSLSEQQSIVDYLDSAFAKIDAMKANAEKALNEAKALFQKALEETMVSKKGWEENTLGEICEIYGRIGFRGYTTKDLVQSPSDGAISLSPSNIQDGKMDYTKLTYISWFKYEESPEIKIFDGDILLVKTGSSYGKSALVQGLPHEATINPQSVVLKNCKINKAFFAYQLRTFRVLGEFDHFVSGTAIPTFSQAKLSTVSIQYPSNDEQQAIVAKLDSLKSKVDRLQENYDKISQEFDALKQAILRQVFE